MHLSFFTPGKVPSGVFMVTVLLLPGCSSPLINLQSSYCLSLHRRIGLVCMCLCVLPSAAGNLITALMHQREEAWTVVRRRNAALQFLFSPWSGLLGLFKYLMWLDNVKAVVATQDEQGRMDGGQTSILAVHVCTSVLSWLSIEVKVEQFCRRYWCPG